MTPTVPRQPGFPILTATLALTLAAGGLMAAALAVIPAHVGPAGQEAASRGAVLGAFGLSWVTAVLGLAPVALLGGRGVMPTAASYFGAMMVRLPACFAGALYLNHGLGYPRVAIFAALAMSYLPLLFIEAGFVGRYLWRKDFLAPPAATRAAAGVPQKEALA